MATSTTNAWVKGFSENPRGRTLRSKSIIKMLERIGSERVRPPGVPPEDPDALLITRRELLARVLWTRDPVVRRLAGENIGLSLPVKAETARHPSCRPLHCCTVETSKVSGTFEVCDPDARRAPRFDIPKNTKYNSIIGR